MIKITPYHIEKTTKKTIKKKFVSKIIFCKLWRHNDVYEYGKITKIPIFVDFYPDNCKSEKNDIAYPVEDFARNFKILKQYWFWRHYEVIKTRYLRFLPFFSINYIFKLITSCKLYNEDWNHTISHRKINEEHNNKKNASKNYCFGSMTS